jgi:biopolymer transport protein ExbD
MKMKRKNKKQQKLNLIPILDAVFIFIFFLLMSAQFLEIYEIDSDAPAVKMVDKDDKKKKEPLNLTLEISKNKIKVLTGVEAKLVTSIDMKDKEYDLEKLKKTLVDIKMKNSTESSVVLRPSENVPYEQIIKIIDTTRKLKDSEPELIVETKDGQKKTRKLFDQIIFETII